MELGLNLSFAVKRWMDPKYLAYMCKNDFRIDKVQFTWDLIDPWWPEKQRNTMIKKYKDAFDDENVSINSSFGGIASYVYAHLLAPDVEQRKVAFEFFKRAIDLTVEMEVPIMGTPVGGMDYHDARSQERRNELYDEMIDWLFKLASYGKKKGLKEIQIEATPLITEFPHSPEVSIKLMKDLSNTDIPIKLLVDWGHALYKPLLKDEADIFLWFDKCAEYIGAIHLQQTDGMMDRHWDFTKEGIVTPQLIKKATSQAGLDTIIQYLEVVPAFEEDDNVVYENMKKTMDYLHRELGEK